MCSNIHSNKKEFKRRKKKKTIQKIETWFQLLFLWISSEIKFIQRLSTFPKYFNFYRNLFWCDPQDFEISLMKSRRNHLSPATTTIPVVHSITWSGHPNGSPDQYQGGCSALTVLRQSSASGCICITGVKQSSWYEKSPPFPWKKIPYLQVCKLKALVLLPLTSMALVSVTFLLRRDSFLMDFFQKREKHLSMFLSSLLDQELTWCF